MGIYKLSCVSNDLRNSIDPTHDYRTNGKLFVLPLSIVSGIFVVAKLLYALHKIFLVRTSFKRCKSIVSYTGCPIYTWKPEYREKCTTYGKCDFYINLVRCGGISTYKKLVLKLEPTFFVLRRENIRNFIFEHFFLLIYLTYISNVMSPGNFYGMWKLQHKTKACYFYGQI